MKHLPKNQRTVGSGIIVLLILGLFLVTLGIAFCTLSSGPAITRLLAVCSILLLAIFMLSLAESARQKHENNLMRRRKRREYQRRKDAESLNAQLAKPDFETRLHKFVQNNSTGGNQRERDMEFWELHEQYERTPTRPIELIRFLLQRISKLVARE